MKEVSFIRQNMDNWKRVEQVVEHASEHTPDELADAYGSITSDLSFARSHYPASRITIYLNNLSYALHHTIYRNKREKASRFVTYWTREVPLVMAASRRELLISLTIFVLFMFVGVLSQMHDEDFVRSVIGDEYIDMTLRNIKAGDPMGLLYGSTDETPMFLGITLNNVRVSFNVFAMGLLTYFGTGYLLMNNALMLGSLQEFMYQQGVLGETLLALWMHGVLEISAIIIAGGAGIALGEGWLMPGTYSRKESFQRAAKRGMKIVVGTVPIFIVAGFIEGFITRHTEVPDLLRLAFILLTLMFVIFYYVYLPYKLQHRKQKAENSSSKETLALAPFDELKNTEIEI